MLSSLKTFFFLHVFMRDFLTSYLFLILIIFEHIFLHHGHVWKKNLRWPSWQLSSPPFHPVFGLFRPVLSEHVPDLRPHLKPPPSSPRCHLGQGCAGPDFEMPSQPLSHQLSEAGTGQKKKKIMLSLFAHI